MGKLKRKIEKYIQRMIDRATNTGLMQDETTAEGEKYVTPGISELLREAGAEGCVLLKNDGALPLAKDQEIALFGRCQLDWFYVGYGSGGDVSAPYEINLVEGLQNAGVPLNQSLLQAYKTWTSQEENEAFHGWWGHWPMNYPEMPLTASLVQEAAKTSKTAVVVIGRAAGEDRENKLIKGSYYLTDEERAMLDLVTASFSKVVVLMDIGNIIDMAWCEEYGDKLSAVMIVWQGGMESGNAVADVLTGKVNPCGRLSDTIARRYEDYPSSANFGGLVYNDYAEGIYVGYRHFDKHKDTVLWPFGYGLSYTTFAHETLSLTRDSGETKALVSVTNTGSLPGKEAVLLWCAAPEGKIDKPLRVLAAFGLRCPHPLLPSL